MPIRYAPALCSLMLAAIFTALWFYAVGATGNTPGWVQGFTVLSIAGISLVGISAALRLKCSPPARAAYVTGTIFALLGIASFYVFNEPSTINLFGLFSILGGLAASLANSAVIAVLCDASD